MAKRKQAWETIRDLTMDEISLMSTEKMRQMLTTARRAASYRLGVIRRAGEFSYAAQQYIYESEAQEKSRRSKGLKTKAQIFKTSPSKMSRNQMMFQLVRINSFFNAETSSIAGIRSVNARQDARIFGTDSEGNPRMTMDDETRKKFWAVYEEAYKDSATMSSIVSTKYGSESVQQMIGDIVSEGQINLDDLSSALDEVQRKIKERKQQENTGSMPNVYSGRGIDFSK